MDVLCIGQANADVLVNPVDYRNLGVDTERVDSIVLRNGGDCMNVAVNLARLGNQVAFVGRIGDDPFGKMLLNTFAENGIDVRGLKVDASVPTASVVALINEQGERIFLYCGGANDALSLEDIDLSMIDDCKVVHVSGTFTLPRFDGNGAASVFALAQKKGKLTSMDVTWDSENRWLSLIRPCLAHLDYFMPSLGEAEKIAGTSVPEEIAAFLHGEGVKNVIVKLGAQGVYVSPAGEKAFYLPSYKVKVVDTTGAGDSFVAGYLTGVVRGWEPRRCAQFASGVSSFCIQTLGATEGAPTFEQVAAFVEVNRTETSR